VAKEVFDEALNPLYRVCFIRETLVGFVATENIIIVFVLVRNFIIIVD